MSNSILYQVFVKDSTLPKRGFGKNINIFLMFEPALIQDSSFFENLLSFLEKTNQKRIIAGELIGDLEFSMDIQNVNYDYWTSKVFAIDGLFYTEIGVVSEATNWGMYIDYADFEVGIVGFNNNILGQLFLDSFGVDKDIFSSPKSYINNMDLMFNFSKETRMKYDVIIKNHTSLKGNL